GPPVRDRIVDQRRGSDQGQEHVVGGIVRESRGIGGNRRIRQRRPFVLADRVGPETAAGDVEVVPAAERQDAVPPGVVGGSRGGDVYRRAAGILGHGAPAVRR